MLRIVVYIFLLFFIPVEFISQSETPTNKGRFTFETSYYYGSLIKIYDVFPESRFASAVDFRIGVKSLGEKYWHKQYSYPDIKWTFSYSTYGNKDVLGSSFTIFPSIGSKLEFSKKFRLNYDAGFGLAYFTNPFDAFTNPTNNVIGSNIVAAASLRAVLEKDFTPTLSGHFGLSFRHYSGGHIKVPNVGANLIYLMGGVKFNPTPKSEIREHENKPINTRFWYKINFGLGFHEVEGTVYPTGGPLYYVYQGTFSIVKRIDYKHRYSVGINYNYYTDYYDFINSQQIFYEKQRLRSSKLILFGGHEWVFNHLSIETKLGVNLYYPFRFKLIEMEMLQSRFMDNYLSGQFGFNYSFFDSFSSKHYNPFIGISIRTIGGKADFVQVTTGVSF